MRGPAQLPAGVVVSVWVHGPSRRVREEFHHVPAGGGDATRRAVVTFKDFATGRNVVVVDRYRDALVASPATCIVTPTAGEWPLAGVTSFLLDDTVSADAVVVDAGLHTREPFVVPHAQQWRGAVDGAVVTVVTARPTAVATLHPVLVRFPAVNASVIAFEGTPCVDMDRDPVLFDPQAHSHVECQEL